MLAPPTTVMSFSPAAALAFSIALSAPSVMKVTVSCQYRETAKRVALQKPLLFVLREVSYELDKR